jgi:hypothetical protein
VSGVALYEIANARAILEEWLLESEGEVTPALEQLLDELDGQANEKVERVALYVRERLARAAGAKIERDRLDAEVKRQERAADGLKNYLKRQLERLGKTKVEGLLCSVALQRNSQPSVTTVLEPEELYALEFARPFIKREEKVVYSIDRAALIAAWNINPAAVPSSFAIDLGAHIRIR